MEAQIIDGVIEQIKQIAGNYRIEKIVLFARERATIPTPTSPINCWSI
jgi:hypothetical protein